MPERSSSTRKLAWRVAGQIRDQLQTMEFNRLLDVRHDYCDLSTNLERWRKTSRHIDIACRRRWSGVLPAIRRNLDYLFGDLQRELDNARRLTERWESLSIPTLRELMGELDQLDFEFGGWSCKDKGILSVTTEPITLEGVYLGPFAMKLEIDRLASCDRQRAYKIEALEPNPAGGSDHVTHPHVRDDELCEGDASTPIKSALEQGRIADFFLLVKSVLTTYNSQSPYVSLDLWDGGTACHECGSTVSDDDRSYCERCDHDYCPDCTSKCECCDSYYCAGCTSSCAKCENGVCNDCLRNCDECDEVVCADCLEDGICPTCREKQDEELDEHDDDGEEGAHEDEGSPLGLPPADDDANAPPDPAILAICLGQAAGVP